MKSRPSVFSLLAVGLLIGLSGVAFAQEENPAEKPDLDPALLEGLSEEERAAYSQAYRELYGGMAEGGVPAEARGGVAEGGGSAMIPERFRDPLWGGNPDPTTRYRGTPPEGLTKQELDLMHRVGDFHDSLVQQGITDPKALDEKIKAEFGKEFETLKEKHGFDPKDIPPGERDDARLRELYEKGRPVGEALQRREGLPELGAPEFRPEPGVVYDPEVERQYRENLEKMPEEWMREHPEYQGPGDIERHKEREREHWKEFEKEHGGREHGGREFPEPKEFERESAGHERPTMEHERPAVEYERPTVEYERPPMEYERPPQEQYSEPH